MIQGTIVKTKIKRCGIYTFNYPLEIICIVGTEEKGKPIPLSKQRIYMECAELGFHVTGKTKEETEKKFNKMFQHRCYYLLNSDITMYNTITKKATLNFNEAKEKDFLLKLIKR